MRDVVVGGRTVTVHVEEPESPIGPDAVLIHGAGFDHTVWRYQARFLAGRGHRVFAPDLPGHGRSEGPPLGSIPAMGGWLRDLIGAIGSERPVLVGHSMGSYVALSCATSHPNSALALVLVGTTIRMRVHPELMAAAAAEDPHAIDLMIGWMHTGTHRYGGHRSAGSWAAGAARRILEHNVAVLGGDLASCDQFDPSNVAAAVELPTLIVSGAADKMTPAADRIAGPWIPDAP